MTQNEAARLNEMERIVEGTHDKMNRLERLLCSLVLLFAVSALMTFAQTIFLATIAVRALGF